MIRQRIKDDLKNALKARRGDEAGTLRLVTAAITNQEKEKRYELSRKQKGLDERELGEQSRLSDEEMIKLIFSQIKQRKDAIQDFERGERQDLAEKEKAEIQILNKYLPKQLSLAEVEKEARQVIDDLGAQDIKDMGRVMGALMVKLGNRAGGGEVGGVVRKLLAGS